MDYVVAMLVSAAVSAIITNALCRKHLESVDRLAQSAVDEMKKTGLEIADRARSVIEETHKK